MKVRPEDRPIMKPVPKVPRVLNDGKMEWGVRRQATTGVINL
jgi:hypothetical protein